MDFHTTGIRFFHEFGNDLGTFGIEEAVANGHVFENLFEGISHSTTNDDFVSGVDEVSDERNFVSNFGATEDGEKRALRAIENSGKGLQFLLHQKSSHFFRQINSHYGRVSAMGGAESIAHKHVTQLCEAGAESSDLFWIGLRR